MSDKLTDKEIVKALECCISNKTCEEAKCPLYENGCEIDIQIPHRLALDLINRLQEENDVMKHYIDHLQVENERLKNDLAISKKETRRYMTGYKTAKAEAYKEFAERLDKEFSGVGTCNYGYVHHKTQKVLKESVGEENG